MAPTSRSSEIGRNWPTGFDWTADAESAGGDDPVFGFGYSVTLLQANWSLADPFAVFGVPPARWSGMGGGAEFLYDWDAVAPGTGDLARAGTRGTTPTVWRGSVALSARQFSIRIVDIVPGADSGEINQNAEPSLAVNPLNPNEIIAAAFGAFGTGGMVSTPYFLSTDGGTIWSDFGSLNTIDKTMAWLADGSAFLTAILTLRRSTFTDILTYSATTTSAGFGGPIDTFKPQIVDSLDQPWIRTGPSGHVYVSYNNLNNGGGAGQTASVNVSTDGGNTVTPVVIERGTAGAGQDAPAVRLAVNGNTVYAAFTRWTSVLDTDSFGEERFTAQIVVVRSDNGGADAFTALGAGGAGIVVAAPTGLFANTTNAPLTLGQERTASEVAIAVDPSDPSHLVIAYSDAPGATGSGQLQLIVAESFDGGTNWATKFATSSATRSAQPALAILADGTIGFLYDNYDPATDMMSQHLVQTSDDFASISDTLLATESNAIPTATFSPYLGDFFDLEAIGNTFYGIFSASNADNGTDAQFLTDTTFGRDFTGTPGTADFQLTDGSGNSVVSSIDPFFFTVTEAPCFTRGTLIMTRSGNVPVEELAIGDAVVTFSGAARPIRWIGRRAYHPRFIADNRKVLPIRIEAGVLAHGVPARDLLVSPEHALYLNGVLVPAALLANGATIMQVAAAEGLEYFHIELDEHDVIFAEGAPTETFVDCDNRNMFQNGREFAALYPGINPPHWEFCARRVEKGSAELAAIRRGVMARARLFGRFTSDPDLHLVVDGEIVRPQLIANRTTYRFAVPPEARSVSLASRSTVPCEVDPAAADERRLGVAVERIVLRDGASCREVTHNSPELGDGFHPDEGAYRWTNGGGRLPAALFSAFKAGLVIEVRLAETELSYGQSTRAPACAERLAEPDAVLRSAVGEPQRATG